ncbi:6fcb2277-d2d8-4b13-9edd-b6ab3ad71412-CDS [Sclerotinia trifoliorum]|uniref:6fcb2277-d2d8-4b13-9edd-b6ab3ad71412-CDS n=1 Tax=Sclerotinia trifoliorum TaxID=28548 RepID=A0A8H2W5B5_9HELO|nr:6fcb2277-d2d8-4b13-9edd-b6ab3ad71412-CDS [Sclerotinia trifoliorum]
MASIKVAEAIPIVYSTMSSTLMPFLYQTRTIAGLHRSICNRGYRNSTLPSICRAGLHTSLSRASYEPQDGAYTGDDTGPQIIRRAPTPKGSHFNRHKPRPRVAFDEYKLNLDKSELESEGNIAESVVIGFEEDDQSLIEYGTEIDALASPNYPKRESTITDSERHTFNQIFTDIFKRTQITSLYDLEDDGTQIPPTTNRESARNKLDNIMEHSLSNKRHRTTREREIEINRYPPALRAAAARAIGLNPVEEIETKVETAEPELDTQAQLREPERIRVEELLRNANTDFELWDVLEKEVFPLIAKMGLGETRESRDQQRRGIEDSTVLPVKEDPTTVTDDEPEISPLALYGPLYPSHLLLGLRLLDRGFSRPSQLSVSILPRIKSFGLLSHVLGASTPLYNELLRISWIRYDDFRTCIDLLNEMEHAGLDFDSETYEIVTDILKIRALVWKGEAGRNKTALWSLPEFKKSRHLEFWQEKIERLLRAKRMKERV